MQLGDAMKLVREIRDNELAPDNITRSIRVLAHAVDSIAFWLLQGQKVIMDAQATKKPPRKPKTKKGRKK